MRKTGTYNGEHFELMDPSVFTKGTGFLELWIVDRHVLVLVHEDDENIIFDEED